MCIAELEGTGTLSPPGTQRECVSSSGIHQLRAFSVHGVRAEWWGTGMAHLEIPSQQLSGFLQLQRHALLSEMLTTGAGQASKLHKKLGRVSQALM